MRKITSLVTLLSLLITTIFANISYRGSQADSTVASYRLVYPSESKRVKGGLFSSGGKGSSNSGTSNSSLVNINLSNIPYVYQYISNHPRSDSYCGLASALMVRAKDTYDYSSTLPLSPIVYFPDDDMKQMDQNLLNANKYGYSANFSANGWIGYPYIDIITNHGLFYVDIYELEQLQYMKTIRVISNLYTAGSTDGVWNDNGKVSNVNITVASASQTTGIIWDHINNYKQPVVVVVDSDISIYMQTHDTPPYNRTNSTLHYVVIKGIRENSNGTRYFSIYDPATPGTIEYTEIQLRGLIEMPSILPAWVYSYPRYNLGIPEPSYRLLVYGD
jgi:hypothetical protein